MARPRLAGAPPCLLPQETCWRSPRRAGPPLANLGMPPCGNRLRCSYTLQRRMRNAASMSGPCFRCTADGNGLFVPGTRAVCRIPAAAGSPRARHHPGYIMERLVGDRAKQRVNHPAARARGRGANTVAGVQRRRRLHGLPEGSRQDISGRQPSRLGPLRRPLRLHRPGTHLERRGPAVQPARRPLRRPARDEQPRSAPPRVQQPSRNVQGRDCRHATHHHHATRQHPRDHRREDHQHGGRTDRVLSVGLHPDRHRQPSRARQPAAEHHLLPACLAQRQIHLDARPETGHADDARAVAERDRRQLRPRAVQDRYPPGQLVDRRRGSRLRLDLRQDVRPSAAGPVRRQQRTG